jgi:hypothetical protein
VTGQGSNKSCQHDLGISNHHCYQVSLQLLVEFISFRYQSLGSKASLTIFYYLFIYFYFLFLAVKKINKEKRKEKKYTILVRKFLPFYLVSHLIQVLDPFDEFWLFLIFELLLDYF